MILDATKIHRHLYQGAAPVDGTAPARAGFQVLALCAEELQDANAFPGVYCVKCPLTDDGSSMKPGEGARAIACASHLASLHAQGAKILVTCHLGLNRSGLVTALTLSFITGWSPDTCVRVIRAARPGSLGNQHFLEMLSAVSMG